MPTYEYRCAEGHAFECIQKMSEPALTVCTVCGAEAVRAISGGAGLIFKGTGFYITDYGKDGKGARRDGAVSGEPASASEGTKPATPAAGGSGTEGTKPTKPVAATPAASPKADTA
ncbi:MAG: zinc ribbon domain-containing protein [Gemmatimonadales bacterium]